MKKENGKWKKSYIVIVVVVLAIIWVLGDKGMIPFANNGVKIGWTEHSDRSSWSAHYVYFNGRKTGHLKGKEDTLHIAVETTKGSLDVIVKDTDGKELFSKEITDTSSYDIHVPERVVLSVVADGHKGSFDIGYDS